MTDKEQIIKELNTAELFLRDRANAIPKVLNEYDIEFFKDISQVICKAIDILENAIIFPCQIGDTLYLVDDYGYKKEIKGYEVGCIAIRGEDEITKEFWEDRFGGTIGTFKDFGETLFLTYEEACKKAKVKEDG